MTLLTSLSDMLESSDKFFMIINNGILFFFFCVKYIFIFVLFMIALLTLTKLRGIYLVERLKKLDDNENQLKKPRLILVSVYIFLAIGIAANFFIYFLIWISFFLPPPLIYQILDIVNPEFYDLNRIKDYTKNEYEFERTIHLIFALVSFEAFLHLILTIWYLVNNNRSISNPRNVIGNLIWSLSCSIVFGFLTFAPFFL
ncbi:MAG: hypothetical protein EU535_07020 [Promethearchaeota archaeon]|nr:MAG: hypothetical protein EU535_07020 [Candidatus Lokiarchaeota archaeon]